MANSEHNEEWKFDALPSAFLNALRDDPFAPPQSTDLTISSMTFLASPKTIIVLSM
jgi:hypothetical protein